MSVDAANALLNWYAVDKRRLPWRAEGGERPDPYKVWLSEVMLQQTTVAAVRPYFEKFASRWPTVAELAAASDEEVMAAWAGLGYYARARNLIACARIVAQEHSGRFPGSEAELARLPGLGRYSSAAVAAIAFGQRAVVVDGNVERVVSRLFAVKEPLPGARPELRRLTETITPGEGSGDFAQAMMDLGSAICTPRNPDCPGCPLETLCEARREGAPERYPLKAPKAARPKREGVAYWLEHRRDVMLVRRPAKGLLGGMLALPTETAPADAAWVEAGAVEHVFTHFALRMRLLCAEPREREPGQIWWPIERLGEAGLPTLFAKLAARGVAWRERPAAASGSSRAQRLAESMPPA
jgi:A/G-specific adenine glycosylase